MIDWLKFIFKKHWFLSPMGFLLILENIVRIIYSIYNYSTIEHPIINILYGIFLIVIFTMMFIFFTGEYVIIETGKIDKDGNFKS